MLVIFIRFLDMNTFESNTSGDTLLDHFNRNNDEVVRYLSQYLPREGRKEERKKETPPYIDIAKYIL